MSLGALQVQVPLGSSVSASVFLVRSDGSSPRLLRLKVWHTPAPPEFLEGFLDLQSRLSAWPQTVIVAPLAAAVDEAGCPSVLSEFRQGIPIADRVRSGRLDGCAARVAFQSLSAVILAAHARGLVHGSLRAGNVLVEPTSASMCLLDFGLGPLVAGAAPDPSSAAGDIAGLAVLARMLDL